MSQENQIAIVGYSLSVPGAESAEELHDMVSNGKSGLTRHEEEAYCEELPKDFYQNEAFRPVGGGPKNYKTFDAKFFGYSPKEAKIMDPQIRKTLEHTWLAFEHAGYAPNAIEQPVSLYMSASLNSYFLENLATQYQEGDEGTRSQLVFLNESDFMASRVAYHFNLTGAAVAVQCGCSSSLVALHQACQSLLNYEVDMSVAGGVAIKPRYQFGYHYEQDGILAENGVCSPFDESASGTVFANGLGFVVLKRLEDAIADNDTIHALISSTAINNDGADKVGYMAPSSTGQVNVIQTALEFAAIQPQDVSYVESHGTGTAIGDPIEFNSLNTVFDGCEKDSIHLGGLKGNIGHIDAASGVVALIKVIEDIKNKTLPPLANFNKANPKLNLDNSPFRLTNKASAWQPTHANSQHALVSSYGIGGTNAAALLSNYSDESNSSTASRQSYFIPFSAKSPEALETQIETFKTFLADKPTLTLANCAYTLSVGRSHWRYRWGVEVSSLEGLSEKLSSFDKSHISQGQPSSTELEAGALLTQPELADSWLSGTTVVSLNQPIDGYQRVPLPGTPFLRTEYWQSANQEDEHKNQKIQDVSQWFYVPCWRRQKVAFLEPVLDNKHVLILADAKGLSEALKDSLKAKGAEVTVVSSEDNLHSKEYYAALLSELQNQGKSPQHVFHLSTLSFDSTDFNAQQTVGLYSLMYLAQASIEVHSDVPFTVSILTDKLCNVSGSETVISAKSTLQGISQVLCKEYSQATTQLIDIDLNTPRPYLCQTVLHELNTEQNCEVALRNTRRFIKDYERVELTEDKIGELRVSKESNVLIIGGLGNFGMELSEFIGAQHKGNVFLSTRTQFPTKHLWSQWIKEKGENHSVSQKIMELMRIEEAGANVHIVTLDVTNKADLESVSAQIESDFGKITGVVHAAGIVDAGMIQTKTKESIESVFAAKVDGTQNVCDVFLPKNPDFIILCSSMNSIIGGLGQLDNTAANAYIDAYAEDCVNKGHTNVLAINWGAVNEARARNYTSNEQFSKMSDEHIKNKMTKGEIFDVYRRLFSTHFAPRVVVSTIDFKQVIINWSRVGTLQELIKPVAVTKKPRSALSRQDLNAASTEFELFIGGLWQDLLGLEELDVDDNFFELGGNSLIAIQFISEISKQYKVRIHAMSIYEYLTLREFAAYTEQLVNELQQKKDLMV